MKITDIFKSIHKPITNCAPYTSLDFNVIDKQATQLADTIESNKEDLINILLSYESYEVATDEIERTLDLLRNLKENEEYFQLRIGAVAAFLPRNQPLYAFSCFVIVPSLMASEVHFRIPRGMRVFFPEVLKLLNIFTLFPNITVSTKERIDFLRERSALLINPKTGESKPATEAVIFTGTSVHADQLRLVFDKRTLFISNGSGHNPVVVSKEANISKAVEAVLKLSLYNQGQDCAAPNSILVQCDIYEQFMTLLHENLSKIRVGPYSDRSCKIGPISDPDDLKYIETIIVDNREWLDKNTGGIVRTAEAIVEPTVICKPLDKGGNYEESFAPILFIQSYKKDTDLNLYFENKEYAQNAMYITLYGESAYIKKLIGKTIDGKILHHTDTFIHNTHLHAQGIERGVQPYGGYGHGASSISIDGKIIAKPTLPQRDIFEHVAKPLLQQKTSKTDTKISVKDFTEIENKNVEKLLRLRSPKINKQDPFTKTNAQAYFDLSSIKTTEGLRYAKVDERNTYYLLNEPNAEFITTLKTKDIQLIHSLKELLGRKSTMSSDDFFSLLYAIPKISGATETENSTKQLHFFKQIYQLLFGKDSGPRLATFLWEIPEGTLDNLLDV